ncbi:MAG: hypothetical protein L0Y80_00130 [Ignavibacteriae bacterium]|nr:hypothetical protein [Ignavibacteriota bacterium]
MSTEYKSIACDLYDIFEVAAMREAKLILTIENTEREIRVTNVYAKGKEEFLDGVEVASDTPIHIRLDQIQKVFDPSVNKSYISNQC